MMVNIRIERGERDRPEPMTKITVKMEDMELNREQPLTY